MTSDLHWWLMSPVKVISYYVWAYVCGVILWPCLYFSDEQEKLLLFKKKKSRGEFLVRIVWGSKFIRSIKF
jgi:hypothetical protein